MDESSLISSYCYTPYVMCYHARGIVTFLFIYSTAQRLLQSLQGKTFLSFEIKLSYWEYKLPYGRIITSESYIGTILQ